jgi:hypothetical protein
MIFLRSGAFLWIGPATPIAASITPASTRIDQQRSAKMSKRLDYDHVAPAGATIAVSVMNAYNRMAISLHAHPQHALALVTAVAETA